jgi:hypothetical protein
MNSDKKIVNLKGSVKLPLVIGTRAIIYHNGTVIKTSSVEAIEQVSDELIVFETRNSNYSVTPLFSPAPAAAMKIPAALCA